MSIVDRVAEGIKKVRGSQCTKVRERTRRRSGKKNKVERKKNEKKEE